MKTSVGILNRPIIKLYPLELSSTVEMEDPPEDVAPSQRPTRKTALIAAQARKRLFETGQLKKIETAKKKVVKNYRHKHKNLGGGRQILGPPRAADTLATPLNRARAVN